MVDSPLRPEEPLSPEELLPLKPDALTVLLTLLESDAHGYAFLRAAADSPARRGQLQPGSLYRLLRKMMTAGLIERLEQDPSPGSDERRRYYRITPFGREVAAAESRRLAEVVRAARLLDLLEEGDPV